MPYFEDINLGVSAPAAAAEVARILTSHGDSVSNDPTNGSDYWLLLETSGPDAEKGRFYFALGGSGTLTAAHGDLVWVWGAAWDESTSMWVLDGGNASMVQFTGKDNSVAESALVVRGYSGVSPFADSAWGAGADTSVISLGMGDNTSISLENTGGDTMGLLVPSTGISAIQMGGLDFTGGTPAANTLYRNNLVHAWGTLTSSGTGFFANDETFNINVGTSGVAPSIMTVEFLNSMLLGLSYTVVLSAVDNGPDQLLPILTSSNQSNFTVQVWDFNFTSPGVGALIPDLTAVTIPLNFIVVGRGQV